MCTDPHVLRAVEIMKLAFGGVDVETKTDIYQNSIEEATGVDIEVEGRKGFMTLSEVNAINDYMGWAIANEIVYRTIARGGVDFESLY